MQSELAARLARVIVQNLATPWPYLDRAMLRGPADIAAPQARVPMFASCFDWHSSVHNHWALVRLRPHLAGADRDAADRALAASITPARAVSEARHLATDRSFELPYGLAWLLTLAGELRVAGDPLAAVLVELERLARDRLVGWADRLPVPIRSGEHSQSALAMALALDWARVAGDGEAQARLAAAAERLHGGERDAPLGWEPSAHDFVSPALGAAWLMARVRAPAGLAAWLDGFAPELGRGVTPTPVDAVDRADGKLVHWDGLNLSRAWMLRDLAAALPDADPRRSPLAAAAAVHGARGMAALDGATYAGAHWLPSFAVYWKTGRLAAHAAA